MHLYLWGKIIWSKHNDVQTVNVKPLPAEYDAVDGERLPLAVKDLGSCDLYPQSLMHGPNGRFVTVCGDGEYIIYTALAWRNKSFGAALDFGWSMDSNEFAVRESPSKIKVYNQFKEGKYRIMVCTDLLGRGIDIEKINIVINYDMPTESDQYLHRVGRAGRYGTKGLAISFISTQEDQKVLDEVQARFEVKVENLPASIDKSTYMNN